MENEGCIASLFAGLLGAAITALGGGWLFMLTVGIAHAEWIHQLPTIGYWWAVVITGLLHAAFSGASAAVHYRGREGLHATRAAIVTADINSLDHRGV